MGKIGKWWIEIYLYIQIDSYRIKIDKYTNKQIDIDMQTDRQIVGQISIDRQTERWRQTDRQTDKCMDRSIFLHGKIATYRLTDLKSKLIWIDKQMDGWNPIDRHAPKQTNHC